MNRTAYMRLGQRGITLVELMVSMVILGVVTTMLLVGWTSLQQSYARSVKGNNARADARDALARASREIRDAQPKTITNPPGAPFKTAGPYEVAFYSAFNEPGTRAEGSGTGALRLTRIYLDTSGAAAQKKLYWQRDTNGNGSFDAADRRILLARDVVNASFPSAGSPTAIFTYGRRDGAGQYTTATTVAAGDLDSMISVQIRLIVDANLNRAPAPADLQTTVRPRNAPKS